MKRVIVGFLATIGFLSLLLLAGLIAGGIYLTRLAAAPPSMPERAVLTLDLRGRIDERVADNPLLRLRPGRRLGHGEIVAALDAATRDPRVRGLLLRLDGDGPGLARAQEIALLVERLRAAGKPVVAHAATFGELTQGNVGYALASAADEIVLQPVGMVGLTGFMLEHPFFRDGLERLGILPDFTRREAYKTAMDMATERELSPANLEMLESIATSLFDQLLDQVARGRGLAREEVRALVDRGPLFADEALQAGLIDRIGHRDEARARALALAGLGSETMALARYLARLESEAESPGAIAIVHGEGLIQPGRGGSPGFAGFTMNADTVAAAIAEAAEAEEVRAILFRIDSGGGSAVASETIAREVRRARAAGKPVIVSMGAQAASGGYWIAMDASAIVAAPGTLTGSIGVIAGKPVVGELAERLGIGFGRVQRGANAGMWSVTEPFDAVGRARLEAVVDRLYGAFVDGVAAGRGLGRDEVLNLAGGRVWTGAQAAELGLVDGIGGLADALARAKEAAGIDRDAVVLPSPYPRPRDPLTAMLELLELPGLVGTTLARLAPLLAPLAAPGPATATLPRLD